MGQTAGEAEIRDPDEASAVTIGPPTPLDAVPDGWPEVMPHPPGLVVERSTGDDVPLTIVRGTHPESPNELLEWFVTRLSDAGWLVMQRERLGGSRRVLLARDRARWLVVVGIRLDESGERQTWVEIRQQLNEQPIRSLPNLAGAWDCSASLPATPPRSPLWCELRIGRPLDALPRQLTEADVALGDDGLAVVFFDGNDLEVATVRDEAIAHAPTPIARLDVDEATEPAAVAPQILAGENDGWLVSWIAGVPPERIALHVDALLRPTDRRLQMSRALGLSSDAAWSHAALGGGTEYAAAWTERVDDLLALRAAGLTASTSRIRRSGRLLARSAAPRVGPALAYDGATHFGLVWGSDDGVMFRAIGTDGLPDHPEHLLEPGPPTWVDAVYGDASFWVLWSTPRAGFWVRTDLEGCADNARGSLTGLPSQAWSSPFGPIAQVRYGSEIRLVRLADRGGDAPDRNPEVVGTSHLGIDWSDLEPTDDGFVGLAHTGAGYATARWICE